jgi:ubiquinone/menaquinone biosynthesis C-methylase UbiE
MTTPADNVEESRIRSVYARRGVRARDSWFDPAHCLMLQERERRVLALLTRLGMEQLQDARILEIGCGTGQWLRDFVKWGAVADHIVGVDLLPDRIDTARRLCAPGTTLLCSSATRIDLPSRAFDIVLQSTVFTSILDPAMRQAVAAEMRRLVRPDGLILWYDYYVNNPSNPDVRRVSKNELRALFPDCDVALERVTLAPPLARAVAPISRLAFELLASIPWLRTHYLAAIRPLAPRQ